MKKELEQLEVLLSRMGDGDLTPDERARVEREVAGVPESARIRSEYDRLETLIEGWRRLPAPADWAAFQFDVSEAIADDLSARASSVADRRLDPAALISTEDDDVDRADANLDLVVREMTALDRMVKRQAGPLPEADWSAFKSRVSSEVKAEAVRSGMHVAGRSRIPASLRWFVPIAAAAVIAIAFFRTGSMPMQREASPAPASMVLVALDVPESSGRIQFSFDESPAPAGDESVMPGTAIARSSISSAVGFEDAELMY